MARPAPTPRPAVTLAVRLRVEVLGARCVPSVATAELFPPAGAVIAPPASAPAGEAATLHGPLVSVPSQVADRREAVVEWGDRVVTPGVFIPGTAGQTEVWAERVLTPGTTYRVTVKLTHLTDPADEQIVYQRSYTAGSMPTGLGGTGASQSPPPGPLPGSSDPLPSSPLPPATPAVTPAVPPAVPPPLPAESSSPPTPAAPPAQVAKPAQPVAAPAPPTPFSESPFRAGEVRVLAVLPPTPSPTPVARPAGDSAPGAGETPRHARADALAGLQPGWVIAHGSLSSSDAGRAGRVDNAGSVPSAAFGGSPDHLWTAPVQLIRYATATEPAFEEHHAGLSDLPAAKSAAGAGASNRAGTVPASPGPQPGRRPSSSAPPPQETGGLVVAILPVQGAEDSSAPSRELLAALAVAPAPDAEFAAVPADDPPPERATRFAWLKRSVALLTTAALGYWTWVPRTDPSAAADGRRTPFPGPNPS